MNIYIIAVTAAAALFVLLMTFFVSRIAKRRYERTIIEYQNKLMSNEMQEVQNIYMTMRGWRHDYHNHMQSIKAYLAKDNIEEAKKYLDNLEVDLDDIRLLFDTGNLNVDAILKATEAYLSDYQEKNPDDTDFRYIPKYVDWLKNDCDYWLQIAEKRGDCS